MNITAMLESFNLQTVSDQLFLDESLEDFGQLVQEESEAPAYTNPIIDKVLEEGGPEAFRTFCNFTPPEFDTLWGMVECALNARFNDGRGRKSTTTPRDALFVTFVVLKYYQTWEKHAMDFRMKAPTLEKMVLKVIDTVQPVLYDRLVTMPSMSQLRESNKLFRNFPYAKYATDVKFQPSHRPTGRFGEQKYYYSGKHKLYGLKLEASVSPEGFLADMSLFSPGSVSDVTIFRDRMDVHAAALAKTDTERSINDNGELFAAYPDHWAVLVDMGYTGLTSVARAVYPKKRPANGSLDRHDLDRNAAVSSDRVVVENFFGRVCLLWKISYSTFVWGTKVYDAIQRLTFALTNFHVSLLPLRQDDHHQYRSVLARYARMAEESKTRRAGIQRRYLQRRAERMANRCGHARRLSMMHTASIAEAA
ncbi:hypothetical protein H310_02606 [Aphanomyces invadans]|uniref:DDE Tnp4 domain-containing protein n=1 Tax=Aphanomyces invadans TaxID=157072 RepID=A0A024UKE2_9STRA|nr:hypothetical protein H310_02606 [Aphanomyces invadans]ETW06322.1 hypothetical protein H310_02606 [Aphanomyces invadans]|eukprot:XP_008864397.1 hypothetical protein H310_02606 [Aphanomyces invadans]